MHTIRSPFLKVGDHEYTLSHPAKHSRKDLLINPIGPFHTYRKGKVETANPRMELKPEMYATPL